MNISADQVNITQHVFPNAPSGSVKWRWTLAHAKHPPQKQKKAFLLGVNLAPLHCHIWLHSGMVISGYTRGWWLTSSFGSMVNYLPQKKAT